MDKDDPDYNTAITIQRLHLMATGKTCALPPPQEVVDLYMWTDSRRAADALAQAKWKELTPEAKELVRIWNGSLFVLPSMVDAMKSISNASTMLPART